MSCSDRHDLILLYAAGALEGDERDQLRAHLASGCPQCAGSLAEADATLARLPLALDLQTPPVGAMKALFQRIADGETDGRRRPDPYKIDRKAREWDRIVLPAALAAVMAVAVTLAAVWRFRPVTPAPRQPDNSAMMIAMLNATIEKMQEDLTSANSQLDAARTQLAAATKKNDQLASMKLAEMTGPTQPDALGRVFIDTQKRQWYFFTWGMKPASAGKTYELWMIADDKKIPAGTFDVNDKGAATLLGTVPQLSGDEKVAVAVTDEPAGPMQQQPTGSVQIVGPVQ